MAYSKSCFQTHKAFPKSKKEKECLPQSSSPPSRVVEKGKKLLSQRYQLPDFQEAVVKADTNQKGNLRPTSIEPSGTNEEIRRDFEIKIIK